MMRCNFPLLVGAMLLASASAVLAVPADLDDDGIPNDIETAAGLDPNLAADAVLDKDMDGWSNLDEYRLGTGINDSDSTPLGQANPHQKVFASDGAAGDKYGFSVAASGDTAVVCSVLDDDNGADSGSAYVYTRTGYTWSEQAKLTASDGSAGDEFCRSVDIEGDILVIGASADDEMGSNAGSAYIFERDQGVWTQAAKLTASDPVIEHFFGWDVAVSGGTVVIGAWGDAAKAGAVYVYGKDGGTWILQRKLTASDAVSFGLFGVGVAIEGDTLLVGSPGATVDGKFGAGAVYAFIRTSGIWIEQDKFVASDGAVQDGLGESVALSGDTALAGAINHDALGSNAGAAYVFVRDQGVWTQQAKLTADDGAADDLFGESVSLVGDLAVIGAYLDDDKGIASGSAYRFSRSGTSWTQLDKLNAADGKGADRFGRSVDLSADSIFVGSQEDDDSGSKSGSAYFFLVQELDLDGDGLTNGQERDIGTDHAVVDSDNDGLTDAEEVLVDADPGYQAGVDTDPNNPDTDGDGILDGDDPSPLVPRAAQAIIPAIMSIILD